MKVALAHCYLNQYGGAERVLERLHELFPDAPVYTSIYDPRAMPAHFRSWDIRTSFMQSLPWAARRHQLYLVFYPLAFEGFGLATISSSVTAVLGASLSSRLPAQPTSAIA